MASPSHSQLSSLSDDEDRIADMVANERMYYVLSQFLETEDNRNIATILQDLVNEIRALRELFGKARESS